MTEGYPRSDLFLKGASTEVSAEAAFCQLQANSTLYIEGGVGHPDSLMDALMNRCNAVGGIRVVTSLLGAMPPYCSEAAVGIDKVLSFRGSPQTEAAIIAGKVDIVPTNLSTIPALLSGPLLPDVAVVQVTPPDSNGYCSLGPSVLYNKSAIRAAKVVIAEVNSYLPRTMGESSVHLSELDFLVEGAHPLPTVPLLQPSESENVLATNVVKHVPDYSTVQLGMGSVTTAIMNQLQTQAQLRIHAGLLSDGIIALAESGALRQQEGSIVSGAFYGSEELYEFVNNNPRIFMRSVEHTHNSDVIQKIPSFISINSAIEVDLSGQINAEVVRGLPISGAGGQGDFIRGARLSRGGKSIIALTATTKGGKHSKIVKKLADPGVVTTPRTEVDLVVTEFGFADLRGKGLRERAKALAAIADPRFSDALLGQGDTDEN